MPKTKPQDLFSDSDSPEPTLKKKTLLSNRPSSAPDSSISEPTPSRPSILPPPQQDGMIIETADWDQLPEDIHYQPLYLKVATADEMIDEALNILAVYEDQGCQLLGTYSNRNPFNHIMVAFLSKTHAENAMELSLPVGSPFSWEPPQGLNPISSMIYRICLRRPTVTILPVVDTEAIKTRIKERLNASVINVTMAKKTDMFINVYLHDLDSWKKLLSFQSIPSLKKDEVPTNSSYDTTLLNITALAHTNDPTVIKFKISNVNILWSPSKILNLMTHLTNKKECVVIRLITGPSKGCRPISKIYVIVWSESRAKEIESHPPIKSEEIGDKFFKIERL